MPRSYWSAVGRCAPWSHRTERPTCRCDKGQRRGRRYSHDRNGGEKLFCKRALCPGIWQYPGRADYPRRKILRLFGQIRYPAATGRPARLRSASWQKGYFIVVAKPHTSTFQRDPEGINQFAAHGAHLSLFTTGCGSTAGGLTPVIKIIAKPNRMQLIADNADFDATPIIRGEQSIEQMGEQLYEEIIAVAAGKLNQVGDSRPFRSVAQTLQRERIHPMHPFG